MLALFGLFLVVIGGCAGRQSALDPAGTNAGAIFRLGNVMFIGAGLIFLLVFALTVWAIWAPTPLRRLIAGRWLVIGGGIAFPVVVLTALLVYGLGVSGALVRPAAAPAISVEVIGERWWWRVHYLGPDDRPLFASANEIRIPIGQPVEFVLKSADVIHSFWAPNLAGKLDMIPGRVNRFVFQADRPGAYRGQCAEYCGLQHTLMAFDVVALAPEAYEAWLQAQAAPAVEPTTPFLQRGRDLFIATGCGACHTVRGTAAAGIVGPDLTHVGSRLTIAAGTFPTNQGTLAGWISDAQHLKPGNFMPSFDTLSGPDLRALAAYMESLK